MYTKNFHASIKDLRICTNNPALEDSYYPKSLLGISAHVRKKTCMSLLGICLYAQIIQRWKTLLSKITIRNFCACTQKSFHVATKDLRIYAPTIQQIIIVQKRKNSKSGCFAPCAKTPGMEYLYTCNRAGLFRI